MPLAGGMVLSIANLPRPCWARRCKARSGLVSEQPSCAIAAASSLVRMSASRCSARVLVRSNSWSMWVGIISPPSGRWVASKGKVPKACSRNVPGVVAVSPARGKRRRGRSAQRGDEGRPRLWRTKRVAHNSDRLPRRAFSEQPRLRRTERGRQPQLRTPSRKARANRSGTTDRRQLLDVRCRGLCAPATNQACLGQFSRVLVEHHDEDCLSINGALATRGWSVPAAAVTSAGGVVCFFPWRVERGGQK